jgi:uncharacterized protein
MEDFEGTLHMLLTIEEDIRVPKNIRGKIGETIKYLQEGEDVTVDVRIDKALQELDDISTDPNIPSYIRTQLWSVISALESR